MIFFTAVACFLRGGGGICVDDFLVMFGNNGFHVIHTAVAYFHIVLVEDPVEFMMLGEVFVYELEEGAADVGLYVLAVWRVIPDNAALSVFCSCGLLVVVVGQGFGVSAGFQGVFVGRFGFGEFSLVAGYIRESTVDGVW